MTTHSPSDADHPAFGALLERDGDTLLYAPLILRELRLAQGKHVAARTIFAQTIASMSQPRTTQRWYDYFVDTGQFATARRLQLHVQGAYAADLNRWQRQWRDDNDAEVDRLRERIKRQSVVLGASADSVNEMVAEAQQLAAEGWLDLANEQLVTIRELLRDVINAAQDERKKWFREAQEKINNLKARIIDHEQELFQQDTYELVWEMLHYADKISVGRGHDPGLIQQIRESVETMFQGGLPSLDLVQSLRDQFQTISLAQSVDSPTAPTLLPIEDTGWRRRAAASSGLLNTRERALLASALGPGLEIVEMNLARIAPMLPPSKWEDANNLVKETESDARKKMVESRNLGLGGAIDLLRQANVVETAARRLLRFLSTHQMNSEIERALRRLVVRAAELRAWAYLMQGAWESAALYFRLSLRVQEYRFTDLIRRETVVNYFAATVLRQPSPDALLNSVLESDIAARYDVDHKLAAEMHSALFGVLEGRKTRQAAEVAITAIWELGKESASLRDQVLTLVDNVPTGPLRTSLLHALRQLTTQLDVPYSADVRPWLDALIERGISLDQEREERLAQLLDKSLSPETLSEVKSLIAELSAYPVWGSVDGQALASLASIAAAITQYFDPQLNFADRDPLAREVQQRTTELEALLERNPTRWSGPYLEHIVANLRNEVEVEHSQVRRDAQPRLEVAVVQSEWRKDGLYYCHLQCANVGDMRADEVMIWVVESNSGEYEVVSEELPRLGTLYPGRPAFVLLPVEPMFNDAQDAFTLVLRLEYAVPGLPARESRKLQLRVDDIAPALAPAPPLKSPFVIGGPLGGSSLFKGRERLIQELVDVLSNPSQTGSVVLFGQKRSGKTSILINLAEHLERERFIIPVRFDMGGLLGLPVVAADPSLTADQLDHRLQRATARMLFSFCGEIEKKCADLNQQAGWAIQLEPMTDVEFFQEPGPGVQFKRYLRRLQENNPRYRLLLMLDEFTRLMDHIDGDLIDSGVMHLFKSLIDEHLLSFVICGVNEVLPVVNRFANQLVASRIRQVDYLSEQATTELISEPIRLPDGGSRFYSEHEVREVFNLTAGNPYYSQIFGDRIVIYLNEQGIARITMADLARVVDQMTTGADRLSAVEFDNLYRYKLAADQPRDVILEGLLVHLIAHETTSKSYVESSALYARIKEFVAEEEFTAAIERLERNQTLVEEFHDVVRRRNLPTQRVRSFRLRVDLFRLWVLATYPVDDLVLKDFAGRLRR